MKRKAEEDYDGSGEDEGDENAYSRAFRKIVSVSLPAADESLGPVLAARKQLVAKKLQEQLGDESEKKKMKKKTKEEKEQSKKHLLPEALLTAKEKSLIKLATKGVVTLFNAVTKAQKLQSETDSLKARDAKAAVKQSKAAFISEIKNVNSQRQNASEEDKPRWSVLQDDFMLGKPNLKDWDKQQDASSDEDGSDSSAD